MRIKWMWNHVSFVSFVMFVCEHVPASLPLFQDPSVCVTMGTACFLYLPLWTPTHPPHSHHQPSPTPLPLSLSLPFPGFSVTMATHVCLLSCVTCFTCCPVSLGQSLCVSVCLILCLSVCPWLAFLCLLFVYLFSVLCICTTVWLAVFLCLSLPVFAFCLILFSLFLSGSLAACLATRLFHL